MKEIVMVNKAIVSECWEYTGLETSDRTSIFGEALKRANKLGEKGWELVSITDGAGQFRLFFKRRQQRK